MFFFYPSHLPGTTVFIGDSHVEQYLPRVAKLIDERPDSLNSAIFVGNQEPNCWPSTRIFTVGESFCHDALADLKNLGLAKSTESVTISYAADSFLILMQSPIARERVTRFIKLLTESGKRVYVILPNPEGRELDPLSMFKGSRLSKLEVRPVNQIYFDAKAFSEKFAGVQADLKKLATDNGAVPIDPFEVLCRGGNCPVFDELGNPLYADGNHLRPGYVRSSTSYVDETLVPTKK